MLVPCQVSDPWQQIQYVPAVYAHTIDTCSVGERRKLKIPASMAYKDIGHPGLGIPGKNRQSSQWMTCPACPG